MIYVCGVLEEEGKVLCSRERVDKQGVKSPLYDNESLKYMPQTAEYLKSFSPTLWTLLTAFIFNRKAYNKRVRDKGFIKKEDFLPLDSMFVIWISILMNARSQIVGGIPFQIGFMSFASGLSKNVSDCFD